MTTNMRDAFARLAAARPDHPWVATRLRHLLDRSNAGTYRAPHYIKGGGWNIR
jgi:hypothetical protein